MEENKTHIYLVREIWDREQVAIHSMWLTKDEAEKAFDFLSEVKEGICPYAIDIVESLPGLMRNSFKVLKVHVFSEQEKFAKIFME